jgi:hypothetical protein
MEKTKRTQQKLRSKWMYWQRGLSDLLRTGRCWVTLAGFVFFMVFQSMTEKRAGKAAQK